MSWCDKLASTPGAGFRMTPMFTSAGEVLTSLAPVLNNEMDGFHQTFNVETSENFSASFNTESGFRYAFDASTMAVVYNYRVKLEPSGAALPIMTLTSGASPYTTTLDDVVKRLEQAVQLSPRVSERKITRVGVIASTHLELKDAPPGIVELFDQVGSSTGERYEHFASTISTIISDKKGFAEKCIFQLTVPEKRGALPFVQLDWQREFKDPRPTSRNIISEILRDAKRDALAYFEKVAEGGLSDVSDS